MFIDDLILIKIEIMCLLLCSKYLRYISAHKIMSLSETTSVRPSSEPDPINFYSKSPTQKLDPWSLSISDETRQVATSQLFFEKKLDEHFQMEMSRDDYEKAIKMCTEIIKKSFDWSRFEASYEVFEELVRIVIYKKTLNDFIAFIKKIVTGLDKIYDACILDNDKMVKITNDIYSTELTIDGRLSLTLSRAKHTGCRSYTIDGVTILIKNNCCENVTIDCPDQKIEFSLYDDKRISYSENKSYYVNDHIYLVSKRKKVDPFDMLYFSNWNYDLKSPKGHIYEEKYKSALEEVSGITIPESMKDYVKAYELIRMDIPYKMHTHTILYKIVTSIRKKINLIGGENDITMGKIKKI